MAEILGTLTATATEDSSQNVGGSVIVTGTDATGFFTAGNVEGVYGTLSINKAGIWSYVLDNSLQSVQSLNADTEEHDLFMISWGYGVALSEIDITVVGKNDPASFSGDLTSNLYISKSNNITGKVLVGDLDVGEKSVTQQVMTSGYYGNLTLSVDGDWTYSLFDDKQELYSSLTQGVVDNFTITSSDGTSAQIAISLLNLNQSYRIYGTAKNDTLKGAENDNQLFGLAGNDKLTGGVGNDLLDGGADNDKLTGGAGDDTYIIADANGAKSRDTILEKANEGTDTVISSIASYTLVKEVEILQLKEASDAVTGIGYKGKETITGNSAANTINGKEGNDKLTGGTGNDTFVFDTKLTSTKVGDVVTFTNVDEITDFTNGDVLSLSAKVFTKLKGDTDLSDNIYIQTIVGVSTQDVNDYLVFDLETGRLYYDADGSGTKFAAVQFATLTGVTTLTASDLHIV